VIGSRDSVPLPSLAPPLLCILCDTQLSEARQLLAAAAASDGGRGGKETKGGATGADSDDEAAVGVKARGDGASTATGVGPLLAEGVGKVVGSSSSSSAPAPMSQHELLLLADRFDLDSAPSITDSKLRSRGG